MLEGVSMPAPAAKVRTFRMDPATSDALDAFADTRFGGNKTKALQAAIQIAALIYDSPHGRAGADPADALERFCAGRRGRPTDD